jgi:hypothetical protein
MGPRRPPPLRDRPLDISTLTLVPQQRLRPNKSFKKSKTTDPNSRSVQAPHRVLGVPGVLEFDEREAGRVPRHPHVPQRSIFTKRTLDLVFARRRAQIANVYFAG